MCRNASYNNCSHGREAWCVPTLHDYILFVAELKDELSFLITTLVSIVLKLLEFYDVSHISALTIPAANFRVFLILIKPCRCR